jgi:hypothetical protein
MSPGRAPVPVHWCEAGLLSPTVMSGFSFRKLFSPMPLTFISPPRFPTAGVFTPEPKRFLYLFLEDSQLNIHRGGLEVRPPARPSEEGVRDGSIPVRLTTSAVKRYQQIAIALPRPPRTGIEPAATTPGPTDQRVACGSKMIRSRVRVACAKRSRASVGGRTFLPQSCTLWDF